MTAVQEQPPHATADAEQGAAPARVHVADRLDRGRLSVLRGLFAAVAHGSRALDALAAVLSEFTGQPARVRCRGPIAVAGPTSIPSVEVVLGQLELVPGAGPALLELEPGLVHGLVDLALGGPGTSVGLQPPTRIEAGAAAVLVGAALRAVQPHLHAWVPRPRLLTLGTGRAVGRLGMDPLGLLLLEIDVGPVRGLARLLVPASVLPPPPVLRPRQANRLAGSLPRVNLRLEVGRSTVDGIEVERLFPGDVLLLEALWTRCDRGEPGRGRLRTGRGQAWAVEVQLECVGERYRLRIERGLEPEGARMEPVTEVPGAARREAVDGAGLLREVSLEVIAELTRIELSVEEVLALHPGQILELGVGPSAPIQLSVQGRVIGRGSLVEIEGQLGVRLVTVGQS